LSHLVFFRKDKGDFIKMIKLFLLTISLLIFFALNSSSQIVHAQVSDTEEKEIVSENFSQDLIKNLERISKNISQLTTLYLKKLRDYIDAQIAKETTSDKEIKQSDTYNEAAKKLAEIEAKIKVEKAFIAYMEKDYKKAYKLLSPLAEQGNDKAQFTLGLMFNDGQGVPQDYEEAIKWFRLAAEQENHKAQLSLGLSYKDGKGVIKDLEEAMKLVTLAADGGIPLAQYYLGLWLHAKGLEKVMESTNLLNPDLVANRMEGDRAEKEYYISAHKWLNLSISNFDARTQSTYINDAKETRSNVEKELQPMDLKEAQRLAKEWTKGGQTEHVEPKTPEQDNIKAKQQEDYAVELFSNAEKEKLAAQEADKAEMEEKVRRSQELAKAEERMRNGDDTSNSNLAKILLSYQNPKCRNYTFIDLFGDILINRKWQDVQHKNAMNKKLVMLNAFDTNLNKDIEIVFEILPNGSYEAFTDPMWGLSPMAQLNTLNLATTLIPVVMKKCF